MVKRDPSQSNDMQAVGHQVGSLASVLVVAAVQFGIPLTPGQQSSILSLIAVAWALFATIYGIRHRIPRRTPTSPTTTHRATTPRAPRSPSATMNTNGNRRRIINPTTTTGNADQPEPDKVP